MPYEDKKAVPQRRPHAVTLDERSHLTVTGVDEVVRFDDTEVSMRTSRGMLTVHGEGLRAPTVRLSRRGRSAARAGTPRSRTGSSSSCRSRTAAWPATASITTVRAAAAAAVETDAVKSRAGALIHEI